VWVKKDLDARQERVRRMCDMLSQRECRKAFQRVGLACVDAMKWSSDFAAGFNALNLEQAVLTGPGKLPEALSHGG
jgi:hypothetical protein